MNPVTRWQIIARDPAATARFYSTLFGWRIDASNALGYRQLTTGGTDGGVWPSQGEGPDMVQLFVEVDDITATLDAATALGARVIVPRSVLPDGDVMAVLLDPAGLAFGLHERRPMPT
ncbi:MAG: VOC family protein [Kofleriaceae bacterium]